MKKKVITLSLQEELERDAAETEKEIASDPKLMEMKMSDEMVQNFYEKLKELEKETAAESADSAPKVIQEDDMKDAIRFHYPDESRSVVRYRRRKFRRKLVFTLAATLAAILVMVLGMSMTTVGSKSYVKTLWERFVGRDEAPANMVNVQDMDSMKSEDTDKVFIFKEIKDKFGINAVRMVYLPTEMYLDKYTINEDLMHAQLFYRYDGEIITYNIYANASDSSWGNKNDNSLIESHTVYLDKAEVVINEYELSDRKGTQMEAWFKYNDAYYQLIGVMEPSEFEKIVENLLFL